MLLALFLLRSRANPPHAVGSVDFPEHTQLVVTVPEHWHWIPHLGLGQRFGHRRGHDRTGIALAKDTNLKPLPKSETRREIFIYNPENSKRISE